jgi:hypothetical protein
MDVFQGLKTMATLFLYILRVLFSNFELVVSAEGSELVIRFRSLYPATRLLIIDENKKEITSMVTISADKKRTFSIQPVDAKGRPAPVDGVPVWAVSPEGGVTLFPAADGLSCDVAWLAPKAGQVVTVTADADLGEGVKTITGTVDVQTLASEAVSFTISTGEEVDNA